jgi:hypothetical protein
MNFETIKQKFQNVDINALGANVVSGAVVTGTSGVIQLIALIISLITSISMLLQSRKREALNQLLIEQDIESKRIDNLIKLKQAEKGDTDEKPN